MKNLYEIATEILHDFHFAIHRSVSDSQSKRRIEVWRSTKDESDNALVWLEVINSDDNVDPYISTDILRSMNEENVTKLFFFTNGSLEKKEKEVLDGKDHYIFTPGDIIDTTNAIEKKRRHKHQKKRKSKVVPTGYTLLKNYMKGREVDKGHVLVRTSKINAVAEKYINLTKKILEDIDHIEDINNITPEIKEKFKRMQHDILPEVLKISVYRFTDQFTEMQRRLFSLLQYLLIYIGAVIEYESEDEMKRAKDRVEEELEYLNSIEAEVEEYSGNQMRRAQKYAYRLIAMSVTVIVFFTVFFFMLVRE
jgi:hypothetical protein